MDGSKERMWKPSLRIHFESVEARIISSVGKGDGCQGGAGGGVGVMESSG